MSRTLSDNDPTPQLQAAPRYLRDYGSSPGNKPTDPRRYMTRDLTASARELLNHLDRASTDPAEMAYVAMLADRLHASELFHRETAEAINGLATMVDPERTDQIERWIKWFERMRKRILRYLIAAIIPTAASLGGVVMWLLHRDDAARAAAELHGAEVQRMAEYERAIIDLRTDIRDLRNQLAGRAPREPMYPGSSFLVPPSQKQLSSTKGPIP